MSHSGAAVMTLKPLGQALKACGTRRATFVADLNRLVVSLSVCFGLLAFEQIVRDPNASRLGVRCNRVHQATLKFPPLTLPLRRFGRASPDRRVVAVHAFSPSI